MGSARASPATGGTIARTGERHEAALVARVLGTFEVVVDGRAVAPTAWRRTSSQRLVKLLLLAPGHRVTREAAAERLWPEQPPGRGQVELRKALLYARRALGDCPVLLASRLVIGLGPRLELDLDQLEEVLVGAAGELAPGGPHAALPTAVRVVLATGVPDILPDDGPEPWIEEARERLRGTWQAFALPLARRLHADGWPDESHLVLERVLQRDPADEAAHRLAIELYASEGRLDAARRQFEQCRTALRRELDMEPGDATLSAILAAEPAVASAAAEGPDTGDRLVDRSRQMTQIRRLLRSRRLPTASALVIRGPTGIGKTRLLQESIQEARATGWRVLEWQAVRHDAPGAFAPLRVGLAAELRPHDVDGWDEPARSAVAVLVPGLAGNGVLHFADEPALVAGVVAAIVRLAHDRPLLLAWDDLIWLDRATLSVLESLMAVRPPVPLVVIVALRDDEPAPAHVAETLDHLRRTGVAEIRPDPLDAADIETLVALRLGGGEVAPALGRQLVAASRGNPLFALELALTWRDDGDISLVDGEWMRVRDGGREVAPESIRRLVSQRADRLPPPARTVLEIISELPDELPLSVLDSATALDRATLIDGLEAALGSGLLVERRGGYAFAHPLYRLAMRDSLGTASRGDLRLAMASALGGLDPDTPAEVVAAAAVTSVDPLPIAEHALVALALGATNAAPMAAAYGFAAGHALRRLCDGERAAALFDRALEAWAGLDPATASVLDASSAYVALGKIRSASGDDAAGEAAFARAVTVARSPDEVAAAAVARYWVPYRHGAFAAALAVLEEGLEVIPATAAVARARLRREIGGCLLRMRRLDEALPVLRDAMTVFEAHGDQQGIMRTTDMLGCMEGMAGRCESSVAMLDNALAMSLELGDTGFEAVVRTHLTGSLARCRRFELGRLHARRSIDLCRLTGDRYAESVAQGMVARLEDEAGEIDAAARARRMELALLEVVGGNPRNESWAHAHLAVLARHAGDGDAAAAETAHALEIAGRSPEPDARERIAEALARGCWADVGTA